MLFQCARGAELGEGSARPCLAVVMHHFLGPNPHPCLSYSHKQCLPGNFLDPHCDPSERREENTGSERWCGATVTQPAHGNSTNRTLFSWLWVLGPIHPYPSLEHRPGSGENLTLRCPLSLSLEIMSHNEAQGECLKGPGVASKRGPVDTKIPESHGKCKCPRIA